jgi:hypothetical protein
MMNDIILMVEYLDGEVTVQRSMNQRELAVMLLEEDVILLSVNKHKIIHRKKRGSNYGNCQWE